MPRTEQNFERRIQKILESKGYLVINATRSKPFDLIAIRNMTPAIIELKGKHTRYPEEQKKTQMQLCKKTGNEYVIIKQSKKKGKIIIEEGYSQGYHVKEQLGKDLKKWLE